MYFTQTYGFYFYITWLPTYLENVRGMKSMKLGLLAGLPLLLSVFADLLGGLSTDYAVKRFGLRWGRSAVGLLAFAAAAGFMAAGRHGRRYDKRRFDSLSQPHVPPFRLAPHGEPPSISVAIVLVW